MKSRFLYARLAALPILLTACSSDMEIPENPNQGDLVPVHFNLSFSGMNGSSTRSLAPGYTFSDGSSISILKCYVYNQSGSEKTAPSEIIDIDIKTVNNHPGGDLTVLLPKGQQYDFVFVGTSIPHDNAAGKLYYSQTDRTISVDYSQVSCNDEELDCFYAVQTDVTTETVNEHSVMLSRPFAQLNIGTQDFEEYNTLHPVKDIAVSVDGIYNKIYLMDGEPVGEPIKADIKAAPLPEGQVFPMGSEYDYLSMNYLLVDLRKLVNVTVTVNHVDVSDTPNVLEIQKVAVERNYQTNVYGKKLLTEYNNL